MATRFLNSGVNPETDKGNAVSFAFDRDKTLASKVTNGAGTVETRYAPLGGVEKVTASKTLTLSLSWLTTHRRGFPTLRGSNASEDEAVGRCGVGGR